MYLDRTISHNGHESIIEKNNDIGRFDRKLDDPLEKCDDYSDIFELVKKVVKSTTKMYRVGLMLVLADLPIAVGAYHALGTNTIVMNRVLIRRFESKNPKYKKEFTFLVLLHEYLHTLGYTDEAKVRALSYRIVAEYFGEDHPLSEIAERGPFSILPKSKYQINGSEGYPELVKDFEKLNQKYIQ